MSFDQTDRLARPHIEFIQHQTIEWELGGVPGFPEWVESKILSKGADGSLTALLRMRPHSRASISVSAGWTLQSCLFQGAANFDKAALSGLSYYRIHGDSHLFSASVEGCTMLMFLDQMPWVKEVESTSCRIDELPWESEDDGHFAFGAARKTLWIEPVTGEELFLLGTLPLRWNTRSQVHPVVEEAFLLAGDLIGPTGVMAPGGYFWRPRDVWHGPFGQSSGALILIRSVGGPFTKQYSTEARPRVEDGRYRPIVPMGMDNIARGSSVYATRLPFGGLDK